MNYPPQPPQGGPPQPMNPFPAPQGPRPMPQQHGASQAYPQGPQGYAPQAQYGAPQPQYGAPGQPYPQPAFRRGPSKGAGVAKILLGIFLAIVFLVALIPIAHENIAAAGFLGLLMGFGLRFVATGGANLVGKRIPVLPSLAIPLLGIGIGAGAGPIMSEAHWKAEEAKTFENCKNFQSDFEWSYEYFGKIPEKFQRPEAQGQYFSTQVRTAITQTNIAKVRELLATIKREHAGDANYKEAQDAASAGLTKFYDAALEKLSKPSGAAETEDAELRKAFQLILKDLAGSETADVYVAFSNSSKLDAPEGHEAEIDYWKNEDSVKLAFPDGRVKIIAQGDAFSATYDSARRNTFVSASQEAFRNVFDANLLTLKPLGDNEPRKGKLLMEVGSEIQRTPTYFNNYETDRATGAQKSKGLLFGIQVVWTFKLFDREGKQLYDRGTTSEPASNISIVPVANAPEWGVYSILMDSAYYNYSRDVISRFGLTPPAEKRSFGYKAYGG